MSIDVNTKTGHAVDLSLESNEGTTERKLEEIRGARNEGSRVDCWIQIAKVAATRQYQVAQ